MNENQVRFGFNSNGIRVMINGKWVDGDEQVLSNVSKILFSMFPNRPQSKGSRVISNNRNGIKRLGPAKKSA